MDKLKILYACGNRTESKIQLSRFLKAIKNKPYNLKVAAYKISSPKDVSIDWTLDCLLNIKKPELISLKNENINIYFEQIKSFNPDIIISDLEYFTSYIAHVLNITLWQCSPSLINFAVINSEKHNIGLSKQYHHLLYNYPGHVQGLINIIDNSKHNFVCSHFGDCQDPPQLKKNFEWVRPYHMIGRLSAPCQHNIVSVLLQNNKKILSIINKYYDSIVFSEFYEESYSNIHLKNLAMEEEYYCNLKNCSLFLCEGEASFLADAFYNGKHSVIIPNILNLECITNSLYSEWLKLSTLIYSDVDNFSNLFDTNVDINYDNNIKYLHEKIEEL